jgi:hypothetical protein
LVLLFRARAGAFRAPLDGRMIRGRTNREYTIIQNKNTKFF